MISITDGQIFLDDSLFKSGIRPAVNSGLSVSRIGGAAQTPIVRKLGGESRIVLAQYQDLLHLLNSHQILMKQPKNNYMLA